MEFISDSDVWNYVDPNDLWVYDKLILSKKLGYLCGPAGVAPPAENNYVIRPCVNFRMMGRGAYIDTLSPKKYECVPDGYFWCEKFIGRHLSYDYHWGDQVLAVEGFRSDPDKLNRFSRWTKTDDKFVLPSFIQDVARRYKWLNVEVIGGKIIEIHLRYNDDFRNHQGREIIPIWKNEFYDSPSGDRIGFIVKE
jgi:hypothetical protein